MRTITGAALALLLLTGCSSKGGAGNNSSSAAGASGEAPEQPENDADDLDNVAIPTKPPSPTPIASLPADYQGRWGINADDCSPAESAAAKGLMTISGNRLSFYESRGTAANLRQVDQGAVTFDLPMSGEGQRWSEQTRLTVEGDGRSLVRQVTGPAPHAGAFTYQRCPA